MNLKKTAKQIALEASIEALKQDIDIAFRGCIIASSMRGRFKASAHLQFYSEMQYFWKEKQSETVDLGLIRQEVLLAASITEYLQTLKALVIETELLNGEANS